MLKHPYSQGSIKLLSPCSACSYNQGLIIIRFEGDLGFVRCGSCDAPLYSMSERQLGEAVAA